MIEKLDKDCGKLQKKINELIDAVNVLQAQVAILEEHAHPTATTEPTDPYAEQRWVGCLCKLWTGDGLVRYGILRGVALNRKKTKYPYQALSTSFEHCEPVKPDDDIIYKGGDNE